MNRYLFFGIILLILSCEQKKQDPVTHTKKETVLPEKETEPVTTANQVNDTEKKLIRELGLCEHFILPDDCYNADYSDFIQLTADSSYHCFLFVTDGGSGGQDLLVFERRNGKYQQVNDFFAFYDKLPGTSTNNHMDLQLSYRDYVRGYIGALFKWDGKKYRQDRIIEINKIPIDLLIALGITDKKRLTDSYPYVKERPGYDDRVYGHLSFDTLVHSKSRILMEVKSFYYYPETVLKEPVRIQYSNGEYSVLASVK